MLEERAGIRRAPIIHHLNLSLNLGLNLSLRRRPRINPRHLDAAHAAIVVAAHGVGQVEFAFR